MKFTQTSELLQFIKSEKLFSDLRGFAEIYEGGSSYNFCVHTKKNKYLLKLISVRNIDNYNRIKQIHQQLGIDYPLGNYIFENCLLLATKYIEGKKFRFANFNNNTFNQIMEQHDKLSKCSIDDNLIRAQQMSSELVQDIGDKLKQEKGIVAKIIYQKFFVSFQKEIIEMPVSNEIIHGDFTANNILMDSSRYPNLIDFDRVRYGYQIEDIVYLVMQLSGFRGLYGNLRRFNKLYNIVNDKYNFSKQEWLYGIQMFYLNSLHRWVYNSTKKKRNIRKGFCFIISLFGYFRLAKLFKQPK